MSSSSPAPKVPLWVFILADIVLVAAAYVIIDRGGKPLSETAIIAGVSCIFVGILVGCIPIIIYYERQKNEMLDDRQRALEALARTVSSSAEQISIAASGLHEIGELAQRNLKHAEQLPHRLQEKIAEFQAQLANANDTEREELEKELEELRASETDRLQSIADKIARTTTDFAKIETAAHQHLTAANEAVAKLSFGTASAIGKAQVAAEQALSQARQEAAKVIGEAEAQSLKAIAAAKSAATGEIAAQVETSTARLKETVAQLSGMVERLHEAAKAPSLGTAAPAAVVSTTAPHEAAPEPIAATAAEDKATPTESTAPISPEPPHPPKRPRKRREEQVPAPDAATPPVATSHEEHAAPTPDPVAVIAPEPAPVLPDTIPEVAPVAPNTAEPFAASERASTAEPLAAGAPAAGDVTANEAESAPPEPAPKPARKRAPKPVEDNQPGLGLEIDDSHPNGEAGSGVLESVLTSDGATRLVVTAYIGIGNRLFIRGSGPGLSWDKGVPLQFVSIGKWRWETSDATDPVQFKLLKNDEQESAALGTLTIDPGHQQEVTANF